MPTNKLTAAQVKAANKNPTKGKLFDGGRLYLLNGKYWRQDYKHGHKNKTLAHGVYPDVSLAEAREKRDSAKEALARGIDPSLTRSRILSKDVSFEAVGREWFEMKKDAWVPDHSSKVLRRLEKYIFPRIGNIPISQVEPADLLECLKAPEKMGKKETAHRTRAHCSSIFKYGIASSRCKYDAAANLGVALAKPDPKSMAFTTDPETIGQLLRMSDQYGGTYPVRCALRMAPHVFVRPNELRKAEWSELDWDKKQWHIPAKKMKMDKDFIVPLSPQVLSILEDLKLDTFHRSKYLFPGERDWSRPMSSNTVLSALRIMGFEKDIISGHGFRHIASTLLNENGFNRDWIELQLSHGDSSVRGKYNYADHLKDRHQMMAWWSDYLDGLRVKV